MEDDPWSSTSPWDAPASSSAPPLPESSPIALPSSSRTPLGINEDDDLGIPPSIISNVRRPSVDSDPWGGGGGGGGGGVWGSGQDDGTGTGSMGDGGWGGSLDYQHEDMSLETSNLEETNVPSEEEDTMKVADVAFHEPNTESSSSPSPSSSSPPQTSSHPISSPSDPYPTPVSFFPPIESEINPKLELGSVDPASNDFSHPTSPLPADEIPSNISFDDFGDFGGSSGAIVSDLAIGDDPWAIQGGSEHEQAQSEEEDNSIANKGWSMPVERDEDDAWGERDTVKDADETANKVDEWEKAKELAERRMARAPPQVISGLVEKWAVLAHDRYPDPETQTISEGEKAEKPVKEEPIQNELDKYLDVKLANMKEITDLLVDLTDLPPTITAFAKPLYRTSVTERRFRESLTRSSRLPTSTSLLVVPRRLPSLNMTYQSPSLRQGSDINTGESWTSRSRLGEPENIETSTIEDEQSPRGGLLSFFGRKVSGQNLSSTGKRSPSVSSLATFNTPSEDAIKSPTATAVNSSTMSLSVSQSNRNSLEQTRLPVAHSPNTSKPATPRPSLSTRSSSLSLPPISEPPPGSSTISPSTSDIGAPASLEAPASAAPSVVSRFLNRFSRKPAARPMDGPRTLELSAGDFDFLAEVEGAESGADLDDDFLDSVGVPVESLSSSGGLEGFLQSTKPKNVSLPAPLAPPPKASETVHPKSALGVSVPRASETQMDELDFLGSGGLQSSNGSATGMNKATTYVDEWDDFLSDQPIKPLTTPSINPSNNSSLTLPKPLSMSIATTFPSLTPSSPLIPSRTSSASASASAIQSNPLSSLSATPTASAPSISTSTHSASTHDGFANEDEFGDFGDFGLAATSATGSTFQSSPSSFDDFDDFSSFSPAPNQPSAPSAPITTSSLSSSAQSQKKPARISTLASESIRPISVNQSERHERSESFARSFEATNDLRKVEAKPVALPALLPPPPSSSYNSRKPAASLMDDSIIENTNQKGAGHPVSIPVSRTSTPMADVSSTSPKETIRGSKPSHGDTSGSGRSIGSMSDLLSKAQEVDIAKGHWTYTGPTSPPVMALPPPPSIFGSSIKGGGSSPGFFSKGDEEALGGFPVLGGMATNSTVGSAVDQGKSKGGLSQADLSFFDGL